VRWGRYLAPRLDSDSRPRNSDHSSPSLVHSAVCYRIKLFMDLSRNSDSDSSNSQIGLTNQDWNLSRLGCRTNNTPWLQWLCARVWCTVTVEERPLAVNVHVWTCVKCVVWLCVVRRSVYVEVSLDSADRTHTLLRSLILSWREHTSTSHQDNGSPGAHKRKTASQSTQV
jgi:hypothetical protein